jgi:hypothetical protein
MTHSFLLPSGASKQPNSRNMLKVLLIGTFCIFSQQLCFSQKKTTSAKQQQEYIALTVYHTTGTEQLSGIEQYLQASLLPALEKGKFQKIGVFTGIANDTAAEKKLYLLIPFQSLPQLEQLTAIATATLADTTKAKGYVKASHNKPMFARMETILIRAFAAMPVVRAPKLGGDLSERVYELRSYESATEAQHLNKVKMFNEGEVQLFDRLGFNAVFYGQVIAGSRMPNLMYITSFDNKAIRDEHWKTFVADPEWKTMSALPQYQNNVSKIDITFLRPTTYSKL